MDAKEALDNVANFPESEFKKYYPDPIRTEDGEYKRVGDRVFNYYDMEWGTIDRIQSDGWFTFVTDSGRSKLLNGARVSTYDPRERKGF